MPDHFRLYRDVLKRLVDIVCSVILLIVLSPLLAVVAICVWAVCGRPILFHDVRAGLNGKPFTIHKFRTMREMVAPFGNPLADVTRITGMGAVLRRTSLDELPQLWNVLNGDMSLVGPRPLPLRYVQHYSPRQAMRLAVRPGLTGLAQVRGRNALEWADRFELDTVYVESLSCRWAALLDLWIILVTPLLLAWQAITGLGINGQGNTMMREFTASDTPTAYHP